MTPAEERGRLRRLLGSLDDDDLRALVPPDLASLGSWAWTGTVELDGTPLFVKRIPVADVEVEHWPSTRNHFGLPLRYQYGVGSAGFGAAREATMWGRASDWVDDDVTDGFAALLHQRLLPRTGARWSVPLGRDAYVAHWGSDAAIASFVDARASGTHELWLVGEHLPHTCSSWLVDHQDRVDDVVDLILSALAVLRGHGSVHFDAHLANVVVDEDGTRACLVDLGLASGPELELDAAERAFLAAHRHFDVGEALFSLSIPVTRAYQALDDHGQARARRCCGVGDSPDRRALLAALVDGAGRLAEEGLVDVHPRYAAALARYRDVTLYVEDVLTAARLDASGTVYDDVELVARLTASGVELT